MRYILTTVFSFFMVGIFAQTPIPTVNIAVKDTVPYIEKITVGEGDAASELTLTILFNEKYNTLKATLSADDSFLTFAEPVRFKETKSPWLWRTYLSPKKMPYTINYEYGSKYRYTKGYLKKLRQPKNGNIYEPLFTVYGMSPVGVEDQYMVNTEVYQLFQVDSTRTDVFLDLGDVISMSIGKKSRPGKMKYNLNSLTNLSKKYKVTLQRDLCSSYGDSIQAMTNKISTLEGYFKLLQEMYVSFDNDPSKGGAAMFNTIKEVVMAKLLEFPKWHECDQLQNSFLQYNSLAAQINDMKCELNIPDEQYDDVDPRNPRLDVPTLLNIIRNIDRIKLKLISATDGEEREDLQKMAEGLIVDGQDLIDSSIIISDREKTVRDNYYKAVESYKKYNK